MTNHVISEEKPIGTYPFPEKGRGWVCFHCGERFVDHDKAESHFGTFPKAQQAICVIDAEIKLREIEEEKRILLVKIQRLEFRLRKFLRTIDNTNATQTRC